tara:strand:+ start:3570 stop:4334 length:765 start_codon:yes stop_codon:yes gene_type:complete
MKILMLTGKGESSLFIYNALKKNYNIDKVIIEDSVSTKRLIRSRIKKLGFFKVANQLIFQLTISKFLKISSIKRIKKLKKKYNFSTQIVKDSVLIKVSSVNDIESIAAIKKINPDIIIINGTRIISTKVLDCTSAIFINTHVGITPQYRGVHGGYWSLVCNDEKNCGVTIHKVDKGIDTGDIIYQNNITITKQDNFSTYPYLQYGIAIPLLKSALNDIINNNLRTFKKDKLKSNLYYHPTIWGYLYNRIFNGIK